MVLPGRQINPDKLRLEPRAMEVIRSFMESGKVVAAICHAPWLLFEVGAATGRRMTSFGSIHSDVVNAGAEWQDLPVVADQGIVTSRNPGDLDAFSANIIGEIEKGITACDGLPPNSLPHQQPESVQRSRAVRRRDQRLMAVF